MVNISINDEKLVCDFKGRLDTVNCSKWENELLDKVKESKIPVVFNLANVEYVASGFLRVCLQVSKLAGTGNLELINMSDYVRKVFTLSGFDKYLNIQD